MLVNVVLNNFLSEMCLTKRLFRVASFRRSVFGILNILMLFYVLYVGVCVCGVVLMVFFVCVVVVLDVCDCDVDDVNGLMFVFVVFVLLNGDVIVCVVDVFV